MIDSVSMPVPRPEKLMPLTPIARSPVRPLRSSILRLPTACSYCRASEASASGNVSEGDGAARRGAENSPSPKNRERGNERKGEAPYRKERYRRRERTCCGAELACANTDVPACWMIWFLVRLTTSCATFVSRIWLSEADRFSTPTPRNRIVLSSAFFWKAPRLARNCDTCEIASSVILMALLAPVEVVTSISDRLKPATVVLPRLLVRMLPRLVVTVCPAFAPTWNCTLPAVIVETVELTVAVVSLPASVSRIELP